MQPTIVQIANLTYEHWFLTTLWLSMACFALFASRAAGRTINVTLTEKPRRRED